MYGPETITMRGLQSETFAYYVHIYTNDVCWNKISANVKIYQASTGGLLHSIQQPDCSESKSFFFVSQRDSLKLPGGYSWEFLAGVCRPMLQILTLFQTKICHFLHPFLDLAPKIYTRFQTWLPRNYVIIT